MNGIIPWRLKGLMKGFVKVLGIDIWDYEYSELSKIVGLVKQNPLDQLTTFTVRDEIAFGLENMRYPKDEILKKVDEIAKFMKITPLLDRDINQLSGGQKQLTVLSSFLAMDPKILILDEPIAFLDQNSESLLLNQLKRLKKSNRYRFTLVIIEHRLSRVIDIADKLVVLNENGEMHLAGDIAKILRNKYNSLKSCNLRVPWSIDIINQFKKLNLNHLEMINPINFNEIMQLIQNLPKEYLKVLKNIIIETEINPKALQEYESYEQIINFPDLYIESLKDKKEDETKYLADKVKDKTAEVILETQHLNFIYPNSGIKAIDDLSIKIEKGDFIGLVGPNGSGKTTLLYLLANLYQPIKGNILFNGININKIDPLEYARKIGFIFQNPENMIFKSTIKEEILYAPLNFGILNEISNEYLSKLIKLIGVKDHNRNPFKLSWGQKRRLNLSSIFIYNPEIILLDEPFIGQDQKTIDSLIETLYLENKRGKTIIISSHDYHLLLKYTKRILELNKDGSLIDYDTKENYFTKHKSLGPIILLNEINKLIEEI
ncbi:MAG: ABC transporter ATP-binding protein [Candidatus Lokiarchaeota archaeon]|nr:ABC transporter ATP-binding protein [Candidatus Lokiarchaeota archaeon]